MSASLVGSEMCIRDRRPGEGQARRRDRDPGPRVQARGPLLQAERRGPVSYTHLTLPTICSV
eukprot:10210992-Alexandrium_andersonii.AAC.1